MGQAKRRAAKIAELKATGPKKREAEVVTNATNVSSVSPEVQLAGRMKAEVLRRAQWKGAVQQELQLCVQEAAGIRKKITDAKTQYKKDLYNKKFAKIQGKVLQMVAALRQLEAQEAQANTSNAQVPNAQVHTPHVHDEHCNHSEEEKQNETSTPITT